MKEVSLSVHELVDVLFREGDIDSRVFNVDTMREGTRIHSLVQSSIGIGYRPEVEAKGDVICGDFRFSLQGRADLVYEHGGIFRVEEIKSTVAELTKFHEENEKWHLSQAVVYAYLLARESGRDRAGVRLVYISQRDGKRMDFDYEFSIQELEERVLGYCGLYASIIEERERRFGERNASLENLPFPYERKRPGQDRMEKAVQDAIEGHKTVFIEAPTGIGKTVSSLFPAVMSFKDGTKKAFYLTAKLSGQDSAVVAMDAIRSKGAKVSFSRLDSKERMCRTPGVSCNPDECPFAKAYYSKLPLAKETAKRYEGRLLPDAVEELADEMSMCPFELQLDLSEESDVIIGDYNYLFDPMVALQRYFSEEGFGEQGSYVALVDEAHNLVERARDIYGVVFSKKEVSEVLSDLYASSARKSRIKSVTLLKEAMDSIEEDLDESENNFVDLVDCDSKIGLAIEAIVDAERQINATLAKRKTPRKPKPIPASYRTLLRSVRRAKYLIDEVVGVTHFAFREGKDAQYRMVLLDPSPKIAATIDELSSAVFFSATLSPIDYYVHSILGKESDTVSLPSPFSRQNFYLGVAPVSTKYRDRSRTYPYVANYLNAFVAAKRGNAFLFFPSYSYLDAIRPFLDFGDLPVYEQERKMGRNSRAEFLSHFVVGGEAVGLMVLGGPFSEGIDLVDERLGAVAVVGTGFPQVSHERDLIREQRGGYEGLLYAYVYPGLNKVMQAMGRLIRSENDTGAILLIDDRYRNSDHRLTVFSSLYSRPEFLEGPEELVSGLKMFALRHHKG